MSALRTDAIEAVEIPFARAHAAHAAQVEGILTSDDMIRKPHSDLEAMLVGQGMEWARLMLEENLRLRVQLERTTSVVGADGVARESARDSERHLETLLGRVPVQRLVPGAGGDRPSSDGRGAQSPAGDVLARHPAHGRQRGRQVFLRRGGRQPA